MTSFYKELETMMNDIMAFIDENPEFATAQVVRNFDVLIRCLQRHIEKGVFKKTSTLNSITLTPAQELAVVEFIRLHNSFDMSLRLSVLQQQADFILVQSGFMRMVDKH